MVFLRHGVCQEPGCPCKPLLFTVRLPVLKRMTWQEEASLWNRTATVSPVQWIGSWKTEVVNGQGFGFTGLKLLTQDGVIPRGFSLFSMCLHAEIVTSLPIFKAAGHTEILLYFLARESLISWHRGYFSVIKRYLWLEFGLYRRMISLPRSRSSIKIIKE